MLEKINDVLATPLSPEDLERAVRFMQSRLDAQRAEADLVLDAVNDVAQRQVDRMVTGTLVAVMHAANLLAVSVDLSQAGRVAGAHRLKVSESGDIITYTLEGE